MEADDMLCVARSIPQSQKGEYAFTKYGKKAASVWLFYSPEVVDCPSGTHGSHTMHRWVVTGGSLGSSAIAYPTYMQAFEKFREECDKK